MALYICKHTKIKNMFRFVSTTRAIYSILNYSSHRKPFSPGQILLSLRKTKA